MYRCLEGGIIAILQAYVDEDVRISKFYVEDEHVDFMC